MEKDKFQHSEGLQGRIEALETQLATVDVKILQEVAKVRFDLFVITERLRQLEERP